ncbi:DUF4038 domain-containing protein [Actinospica sp. MGRD01-02]|uniref:DUF4038 domain-containing protein n=1 Tax=Actinospica acidithermotolerans TaxID=2828514 RepID=A0A941IHH6_9ACTN|nr:DUF4038 domain-containing protein [Actinospica acidithermotolerans]MBR7827219.1 DUF4038 domain-containing protein [Actinospica acidithermotolerans]
MTDHVGAAWRECEIELVADREHQDAYSVVDVWAEFTGEDGTTLRRPAFFDGGRTWRVRFASPIGAAAWQWTTGASVDDPGLRGVRGTVLIETSAASNRFEEHGFWRMSPGARSLVHADGTPALLVGDTAWALPWRATCEQVRVYAADRAAKGFNAALLMTVQPDMRAAGPRARGVDEGFEVGFDDLPDGRLTRLNPAYFQYLDRLTGILLEHGIVPVLQPVFQGYGWKGLGAAGAVVPPEQYARYCRYLVARYGARPAIYLVGADGSGQEPQVAAGGAEIHACDCYGQPTGIHYRPHGSNNAHQDAVWLDFQWCQTGHHGEHVPERVADMWRNTPARAVANGEPTYERTADAWRGAGWWQGHEAWSNLCAGATMGVVYGAANLWQWKLHPDEPGHPEVFLAPDGDWRTALDFEGSTYVGLVGKILDGLPTTDMRPDWDLAMCSRGLSVPGRLYIAYQEFGGTLQIVRPEELPRTYHVVDPRTGTVLGSGTLEPGVRTIDDERAPAPRVIVFRDEQAQLARRTTAN